MAVARSGCAVPPSPKFAFVRFLEDNVKSVVEICDIKRFNPKDLRDFQPEKAYMVKWAYSGDDDSDEEGEFYKAQILKLAATKEQLNEQLASSRVRIPKVYDTSVEETTDDEENRDKELASLLKEKKAKKKHTEKAVTTSLKNMLENRLKEKKNAPLFQSTIKKRPFVEPDVSDHENPHKKIKELRRELQVSHENEEKMRKKLTDYKELNKRLQDALLLKIETSAKGHVKPMRPPVQDHQDSQCVDTNESPGTSGATAACVLEEKNGKIHIGADVWIASEKWTAVANQAKHSMFVKNLMVAIWGSSVLQGRSLDGKACPRFKGDRAAKPPLSPAKVYALKNQFMNRLNKVCLDSSSRDEEASRFKKYITEKLQDVNRSQQRTAKSNSQPSPS